MRTTAGIVKTLVLMIALSLITSGVMSRPIIAEETEIPIDGKVYSFGDKDSYDIASAESYEKSAPDNTNGSFTISGDLVLNGEQNGIPSFVVQNGNAELKYTYDSALLDADETEWHLVDDRTKIAAGIKLESNIKHGALILQTSRDGEKWVDDISLLDMFKETPEQNEAFYTTNSVQLTSGCFYKAIIVYKTGIKTGQDKVLFLDKDEFDYKKTAEVYEFYLQNDDGGQQTEITLSKKLGTLTNTGRNNGYSGTNVIDIKDPHYGWELGQFFVSGYTRDTTDDDGNPVFLKNVGDQVSLWFNLKQDINRLNNDETLTISDDKNGYDQFFQIRKTDMGRGTLIVRYTDEKGVTHDPEIYTNYLEANATTSADTIVKLFEEGDYEVALDYEIKDTPRKVGKIEVIPEYTDYRISFKFSVRNGNCMVFPFDVVTGEELSDGSVTDNGFKLNMAKSRYLIIDVQRIDVTEDGEDVRFNRPAKDGDEYTEEGKYVFNVSNKYTGESTKKTIYVGETAYKLSLAAEHK